MSDAKAIEAARTHAPETVPVILYPTDAKRTVVYVKPDLEQLQALVNGYIEIAAHNEDGTITIVNEEGLRLRLQQNPHLPQFVGPVVVMVSEDFK